MQNKLISTIPTLRVMIMGPQGSGKSTQVDLLAQKLGLPAISTGKICRERMTIADETGRRVKALVEKGVPAPDDFVLQVLKEKIESQEMAGGFVGEGFPRTAAQIEALKGVFTIVFYLGLSDEIGKRRLMGRRMCKNCGANYNLETKPPKRDGFCDLCGGELIKRDDETEELINVRLASYHEQAEPVLDYYRKEGILEEVDGANGIEEIQQEIVSRLKKRGLIQDA